MLSSRLQLPAAALFAKTGLVVRARVAVVLRIAEQQGAAQRWAGAARPVCRIRPWLRRSSGAGRHPGWAEAVLLECQDHRENFYVACGFHRVRSFPDPFGPDAILMGADLRLR